MKIISREEWGARPPKRKHFISIPTAEHWLHHAAGSLLPGDDTVSDADLRRIRAIQNYHMDTRGWSDIAYSFLMDPDGNVFEGRGPAVAGGHTFERNTISHALCIMGNYDTQQVDSDLIPRIVDFTIFAHEQGWVPQLFTGGHRDAPKAETSCPGKNLYAKIPEINQLIQEGGSMPTAEEIAVAVWEHRTRSGITSSLALDRNYRNIGELTIAHRAGALGADAELDADDINAIVDAIQEQGIASAVARELSRRLAE